MIINQLLTPRQYETLDNLSGNDGEKKLDIIRRELFRLIVGNIADPNIRQIQVQELEAITIKYLPPAP